MCAECDIISIKGVSVSDLPTTEIPDKTSLFVRPKHSIVQERTFFIRAVWDQPSQKPAEIKSGADQTVKEVVASVVPRDIDYACAVCFSNSGHSLEDLEMPAC